MIPPAKGIEAASSKMRGFSNASSRTLDRVTDQPPALRNVFVVLNDVMPPLCLTITTPVLIIEALCQS